MKHAAKKILIGILANVVFYFNASAISDAIKIKIVNGSSTDETVVRFIQGATPGFDASYDAYKMFSSSQTVPAIFTKMAASSSLSINALPVLAAQNNISIFTHIKVAGTYTLQAIELGTGFQPGVAITLEDLQTGMLYNFRNGQSVTLAMSVNTVNSANRFVIHVAPPVASTVTNITCGGLNNGSIHVSRAGNTNWSYELKDANRSSIGSAANINDSTTISNLSAGAYTLYTSSTTTLPDSLAFSISEPAAVIAGFSSADNVLLSSAEISFTNTSANANLYTWDFGDGQTSSDNSPVHQFHTAGTFMVSLVAANTQGCNSLFSKSITVNPDLTTGVLNAEVSNISCNGMNNGIIRLSKPGNTNWNYELKDANGNAAGSESNINDSTTISGLSAGAYMLYVSSPSTLPDSLSFIIDEPAPVVAGFNNASDVFLSSAEISFTNTSSGANLYSWDFGDGETSADFSPVHQYYTAGTFMVHLTASNAQGCTSLFTNMITVSPDLTTGILNTEVSNISCNGMNDGIIRLSKPGNSDWNYELKDVNGSVVSAENNINENTEIDHLSAGTYMLYVSSPTTLSDSLSFIVTEPAPVVANFSSMDTVFLSTAEIAFTNTSTNASLYTWDFGDGETSADFSPVHRFYSAGTFMVNLVAANTQGCNTSFSKIITVNSDLSTGILNAENDSDTHLYQEGNQLHITISPAVASKIEVAVYNNLGQLIGNFSNNNSGTFSQSIELPVSGTYIVRSLVGNKFQAQQFSFIK